MDTNHTARHSRNQNRFLQEATEGTEGCEQRCFSPLRFLC